MRVSKLMVSGGIAFVIMSIVVIALNLALLAGAVWVVVKVLRMMGVL